MVNLTLLSTAHDLAHFIMRFARISPLQWARLALFILPKMHHTVLPGMNQSVPENDAADALRGKLISWREWGKLIEFPEYTSSEY